MIPRLSDEALWGIMSCIQQKVRATEEFPDEFFVISVWFPEPTNKYLHSNTPPNGYCVMYKFEDNYTKPDIINHAKQIWAAGLMPIKIVQSSGGIFYATPRAPILAGDLDSSS